MVVMDAYETLLVGVVVGCLQHRLIRQYCVLILNSSNQEDRSMRRKKGSSITELLKQSGYSEKTIRAILQYYGTPETAKAAPKNHA
jgi:predicted Ser/Thr protein kinase